MSRDVDLVESYFQAQRQGRGGNWQFGSLAGYLQFKTVHEVSAKYLDREAAPVKALDWGSGSGHFSAFLMDRGANVVAYGFGTQPLPALFAAYPKLEHVSANVEEPVLLPFDDQAFDHVYSIGVLEHVHQTGGSDEKSLAEIHRILRPSGLFLCFHLPNKLGWVEPFGKLLNTNENWHDHKYSKTEIVTKIDAAGFDLLELGRYNFLPRNQLRRLPSFISRSVSGAKAIDAFDALLERSLPWFCTNFYFVARKRD